MTRAQLTEPVTEAEATILLADASPEFKGIVNRLWHQRGERELRICELERRLYKIKTALED